MIRRAPDDPEGPPDQRAVSEVFALVLLFGLVLTGAVLVAVAASPLVEESSEHVETERVVTGFRALDEDVDTVAYGDAAARSIDLDVPDADGGAVRTVDTGRIVVTRASPSGTVEIADLTVGTVVYDRHGTTVGYQAGGVWRGTGANARAVSAPNVEFREGTLTFGVTDLRADGTLGSDRLTFREGRTVSPLPNVTAVDEHLLVVAITSRFYGGWAEYFRQRVPRASVSVDHARETAYIRFGDAEVLGDYRPGLVAEGGGVTVANGAASVYTRIRANGSVSSGPAASIDCPSGSGEDCYVDGAPIDREELDWGIRQQVEFAEESGTSVDIDSCSGTKTLTAGTYYSDGFLLDSCTLVFDLRGGNVTLVVDGNVGIKEEVIEVRNGDVNGTCCYARVYTTGDWAMANGGAGVTVDSGNATRFQLYGTSEMHFAMGQAQTGFQGSIYAPRDESAEGSNQAVAEYNLNSATAACTGGGGGGPGNGGGGGGPGPGPTSTDARTTTAPPGDDPDVCIGQGNGDVYGAIIAGPAMIGQASSFEYALELRTIRPTLGLHRTGPDLVYFHFAVHEVTVED